MHDLTDDLGGQHSSQPSAAIALTSGFGPPGARQTLPTRHHNRRPIKRATRGSSATVHRAATHDDTTLRHVIAGTIARTVSQVVIHPLDTIKTRLQVPPAMRTAPLRAWLRGVRATATTVSLPRRICFSVPNWAAKGVGDLYLGVTGALLGTLPTAFVYFSVYEGLKAHLEQRKWCGTM